jgi:hypothetical protein
LKQKKLGLVWETPQCETRLRSSPETGSYPRGGATPEERADLIRHEAVAGPANIDEVRGIVCVLFDRLPQFVDMPLREFLSLAGLGLISLRLCDQSLIIHHTRRVTRQYEQVSERSGEAG